MKYDSAQIQDRNGSKFKSTLYSLIAGASIAYIPQVSYSNLSSYKPSTSGNSYSKSLEGKIDEMDGTQAARSAGPGARGTELKPANVNYSSLTSALSEIEYNDSITEHRFKRAIQNLSKHDLEKYVDEYCAKFKVNEEDVLPYMIIESALDPNVGTNKGCAGIGQMSSVAVKSVNNFYGTNFVHGGKAKNQIGSSVAYYAKTFYSMASKYPKADKEALQDITYFSYNAGGAPVYLAAKRLGKKSLALTWENLKKEITPGLLSASAKFYREISAGARRQKAKIIKSYVEKARTYRDYLEQLKMHAQKGKSHPRASAPSTSSSKK